MSERIKDQLLVPTHGIGLVFRHSEEGLLLRLGEQADNNRMMPAKGRVEPGKDRHTLDTALREVTEELGRLNPKKLYLVRDQPLSTSWISDHNQISKVADVWMLLYEGTDDPEPEDPASLQAEWIPYADRSAHMDMNAPSVIALEQGMQIGSIAVSSGDFRVLASEFADSLPMMGESS